MLGAIAGDIIGSVYEGAVGPILDFQPLFHPRSQFTDDSVLTVAVADHFLHGGDLVDLLKDYAAAYPRAGYGGTFQRWARSSKRAPYYSWGNGSAMRASPAGLVATTLEEAHEHGHATAAVTHDHPEGIKGAQATAAAVFLARNGHDRDAIRAHVEATFGYDLTRSIDDYQRDFTFDVSCQGTVPPALRAFLESTGYEDAVRRAVSLGGDTDTLAAITGSVAGAFYGVPEPIRAEALARLDDRLRGVVEAFEARYPPRR